MNLDMLKMIFLNTAAAGVVGEVVERLDTTERRLALGALLAPPRIEADFPTSEIRTPP